MSLQFQNAKNVCIQETFDDNSTRPRYSSRVNHSKLKFLANVMAVSLCAGWITPLSALATEAYPDLTVSVASPGVQSYADSGLTNDAPVLVESFDGTDIWGNDYWDANFESEVGVFSSSWSGIFGADQWGGAGGTGRYASAGDITLTLADTSDYEYLGFWWSAGSVGNEVELLDNDDNVLARFTVDEEGDEDLNGVTAEDEGYTDNPNTNIWCGWWQPSCWETGEQYAFVHLRYPPGFRKVRFYVSNGGNGFEFDNVTISTVAPDFSSDETTTETFNSFDITTPPVLIADPRTGEVDFPGINLDEGENESNAMLCFSQVENAAGAALSSAPSIQMLGVLTVGITSSTETNLQVFSGARDAIESFSSGLTLTPINFGEPFATTGSIFIRVTATPQTNAGSAGCTGNATRSEIIDLRFIIPLRQNSFQIQID